MTNGNNNGHHPNGASNGLVHSPPRAGHGVNGNGHKPDAAIVTEHELLWDGLAPVVTQALAQPLDTALVSQRKGRGGRVFDYLEGHVVIDQANRIFGYGGWGVELIGDVTLRRIETVDAQTGEVKVSLAYSAPVRVTVAGALPRTDIGVHPVTEDTQDGHDTAMKAAVTDGMKRAFRSFGPQFGNSLYGDQSAANVPSKPQRVPVQAQTSGKPVQAQPKDPVRQAQSPPSTGSRGRRNDSQVENLRKRLMELCVKQGFDEEQVQTAIRRQTGKDIDDLTADEIGELIEAAANKLNQMRQAQAA